MGKKGEGIKKYKLVVTEHPWGCKEQHGDRVAKELMHMTHGRWFGNSLSECWVLGGGGAKGEKSGQL